MAPSRISKNTSTAVKSKSVLITSGDAKKSATVKALDTVGAVISKIELDIISNLALPTTEQLKSISVVLAQLDLNNQIDDSVIALLKTCVNIIQKYVDTANDMAVTLSRLESSEFKAKLLDDIDKLNAFLLKRGVTVFPPQTIVVKKIKYSQAIAIHIQQYGLPLQLTKLAMIEQNLQNRTLTLDGKILSMLQQFVDTLTT
jgi:hypothetical protein